MQQRDEPAERRTEHAVDPALALDIQQDSQPMMSNRIGRRTSHPA
jgi:hypothetical protein